MKYSVVFILVIFSSMPLLSGDQIGLSFMERLTDNLFQTYEASPDRISAVSFSFEKNFPSLSLFGQAGYAHFAKNTDLSFLMLDAGVDKLFPLGSKSAVYISGTASGSLFQHDFSEFDHLAFVFSSGFKTYLGETSILKSGYDLEFRRYREHFYDFISHSFFLSIDKYFPSRTTVKAEFGWGRKTFLNSSDSAASEDQTGGDLQGPGHGRGPSSWSGKDPALNSGNLNIQNLKASLTIAQGLTDFAGLNLVGSIQETLSGSTPFSNVQEFFYADNPTYDRFAWEGWELGTHLTVEAPWHIEAKIGYNVSDKRYPGIEAMSLEGVSLGRIRKDRRKQAEISLEKNFRKFTVFLSVLHTDNRSNDPLYVWKGPHVSLGIDWTFSLRGKS